MASWILAQDGEYDLRDIYLRHYSSAKSARLRQSSKIAGPGETIILTTAARDALWVWRKFRDDSGQQGINCAVFRNEQSGHRSSDLVREADAIADLAWPGERHYTYVRAEAVASRNPGWCFICAGWGRCGHTKGGLLILEKPA